MTIFLKFAAILKSIEPAPFFPCFAFYDVLFVKLGPAALKFSLGPFKAILARTGIFELSLSVLPS